MDSIVPTGTRTFTVSLPERLATQAEELAKKANRDISELFRDLLRAHKFVALERELPALRPPYNPADDAMTEDDIEAMVDEVRSEKILSKEPTLIGVFDSGVVSPRSTLAEPS